MSDAAAAAINATVMDPQQDRDNSTEGSGDSEEAAEGPAADDAASAGPYAQAALQSLLAYDSAIAQQVSEIAAEHRAGPGDAQLQPAAFVLSFCAMLQPCKFCVMPSAGMSDKFCWQSADALATSVGTSVPSAAESQARGNAIYRVMRSLLSCTGSGADAAVSAQLPVTYDPLYIAALYGQSQLVRSACYQCICNCLCNPCAASCCVCRLIWLKVVEVVICSCHNAAEQRSRCCYGCCVQRGSRAPGAAKP